MTRPRGRRCNDVERPAAGWFVLLDGGIAVLAALALRGDVHQFVRRRARIPPRRALCGLLGATALVHLGEALYAYRTAARLGSPSPGRWAAQTFAVGFPSLSMLSRIGSRHEIAGRDNAGTTPG